METARKEEWLRAAEAGDASAQYEYGFELFYGAGDEPGGLRWLKESARQQFPAALLELVFIYLDESGSGQFYAPKKGVEYLLQAVELGYAPAITRYARALEEGDGVEQNIPEALNRYIVAAAQGEGEAAYLAADMLRFGREPYLAPQPERAMELLRKSAQLEDAQGMFEYARCHEEGSGVGKDLGEARKWYLRAAEQEHTEACLYAGGMLLEGIGGDADAPRAVALLETAAADNHVEAAYYLAGCCMEGTGTARNPRRALELMKRCADAQFFDAAEILSQWEQGNRVRVSPLSERYRKKSLWTVLGWTVLWITVLLLIFAAVNAWEHYYAF